MLCCVVQFASFASDFHRFLIAFQSALRFQETRNQSIFNKEVKKSNRGIRLESRLRFVLPTDQWFFREKMWPCSARGSIIGL